MYQSLQRIVSLACLFALPIVSRAQGLDLPRVSQHAKVTQRIGITEITIDYSRPLVNGRKIWGGLEAYGKVWRAGANENTTIEFSDPVRVEGKPLHQGTYGLHMIPGEKEWTVIFSKNHTSWGSYTYDSAEDALRVSVTPQASELHEALTYNFENPKPDSTVIAMRWEKIAVPFKVDLKVDEIVQAIRMSSSTSKTRARAMRPRALSSRSVLMAAAGGCSSPRWRPRGAPTKAAKS